MTAVTEGDRVRSLVTGQRGTVTAFSTWGDRAPRKYIRFDGKPHSWDLDSVLVRSLVRESER